MLDKLFAMVDKHSHTINLKLENKLLDMDRQMIALSDKQHQQKKLDERFNNICIKNTAMMEALDGSFKEKIKVSINTGIQRDKNMKTELAKMCAEMIENKFKVRHYKPPSNETVNNTIININNEKLKLDQQKLEFLEQKIGQIDAA